LQNQAEKNRCAAAKRRKRFVEFKKSLCCERCRENHPATLTFHHKSGFVKEFELVSASRWKASRKRLLAEIEKCEVLCANCHAKKHWAQRFE
jgi:hypothetical protein